MAEDLIDDFEEEEESTPTPVLLMRVLLVMLVMGLAVLQLFMIYRGLFQPAAMDQAQIARHIAQGEGFTTKFYRPIQVVAAQKVAQSKGRKSIDFDNYTDTNYAPVYPYVLAAALAMTGNDDFEATKMEEGDAGIYGPDRVISAVSMFFLLLALTLSFFFLRSLFDESVAISSVILMALSTTMLEFGISGLAQTMLMSLFLGVMSFALAAIRAQDREESLKVFFYLAGAAILLGIMCITSWICLWLALGVILYVGIQFRPHGMY